MGLANRLLGEPHGPADDGSGGLIRRARLYEAVAAIGYVGRRRHVYDILVTRSGAKPGDHVLDIGCGTGYLTRRAARAVVPGGRVTGIDPSRPVIAYARRHSPPVCRYVAAGAQQLPLPDASVDVAVSAMALHHLPAADRPAALAEIARVLCPGGILLLADFRPPANPIASHMIGAITGHAMQHNPIDAAPRVLTRRQCRATHPVPIARPSQPPLARTRHVRHLRRPDIGGQHHPQRHDPRRGRLGLGRKRQRRRSTGTWPLGADLHMRHGRGGHHRAHDPGGRNDGSSLHNPAHPDSVPALGRPAPSRAGHPAPHRSPRSSGNAFAP